MSQVQRAAGVAIVTGATGGIGAAAARLMAEAGWPLLLCARTEAALADLAKSLQAADGEVEVLAGDIADPAFPERLAGALAGRPVGAVIHAAGISPTMGSAERVLQVNLDATVRLVETVRPRMSKGGAVVLFASVAGHRSLRPELDAAFDAPLPPEGSAALLHLAPSPGFAYAASKRAVIRLAEREAAAFGQRGARIVSVSPALIDTEMTRAESGEGTQTRFMLDSMPLGRLGGAEEAAAAAVFLCSPAASFITGADLLVDGGTLAGLKTAGAA